jgi:acetyl-CoA acetyltransferase
MAVDSHQKAHKAQKSGYFKCNPLTNSRINSPS